MSEKTQRKYWKAVGASKYSDDFKNLVASMISYDPKKRPTIGEVEKHPWLNPIRDNCEKTRSKLIKEMDW